MHFPVRLCSLPRQPLLADWYAENHEAVTRALADWVAIPSVVSLADLAANGEWAAAFCSRHMTSIGLRHATIIDTAGQPAAYAEWHGAGDDALTVLVVGHSDVQPAAPLAEWSVPPFAATVEADRITGRGVADAKGPILAAIESMHGSLASGNTPRINVKFLVEGESTIGSPNLADLLGANSERFAADVVVVPVPGAGFDGRPTVLAGTRGQLLVHLQARTATHDAYTGNYAGGIANPVDVIAKLISDLHRADGRINIPGFYHRVRDLSDRGREILATIGFDQQAWLDVPGARVVGGEQGFTPLERILARPSADVTAIAAGNRSASDKAIIPATASATIAFGLVPDQSDAEVLASVRSWVSARLPKGVELTVDVEGGNRAHVVSVSHPAFGALLRATKRVWGSEPVLSRHGGVGAPDALLDHIGSTPLLLVPVGGAASRLQSPNECLTHEDLRRATLTFAELWAELEKIPPDR